MRRLVGMFKPFVLRLTIFRVDIVWIWGDAPNTDHKTMRPKTSKIRGCSHTALCNHTAM